MADKTLKARIKLRTGDDNYWADHDTDILLKGEPSYNSDTGLLYIGNGENEWLSLSAVRAENADTADRLSGTAQVGSSSQPVYFANGLPAACDFTVPSNPKFTDTTYEIKTGSANGTIAVNGTDVAVKGLGAVAYKASVSKSDVGLGSVVNAGTDSTPTANSTNYITSGGVKKYVDEKVIGAVQYLGTVSSTTTLAALTPDSVGDFCRVSTAFGDYHVGDLLLCKTLKTSSAAATWDVVHGEIDKNTWTANSASADGYVSKGSGQANKVWKTDASGNPGWRDDANTTYSAATASANGLMTSAHFSKLEGIAAGAQVNQNAFSNVVVGSTTVAADSATDTLTLAAGANITLTPDATNDKITIAATNTTYSAATTSAAGLMSAADKKKLDGIATSANNYSLPLAASGTRGGMQIGFTASGANIPVQLSSEKAYVGLTLSAINSAISGGQITPGEVKIGNCTIKYNSTTPGLEFSFS